MSSSRPAGAGTRSRRSRRRDDAARKGYVLFAVLVVVVVLSLVAYQYQDAMASEYTAAVRVQDAAQARANAIAGIHYAAGIAADPNSASLNLFSDQTTFANRPVGSATDPRGGCRFALVTLADNGGADAATRYSRAYGLADESAKLNVNTLILQDPTGNLLYTALMLLPNMTEDVADAIVDWLDADSTSRPSGAEDDYYSALPTPYRCKNGPINSLEELLLVKGVTPDLLFGTDRNRNGVQDGNESQLGAFSLGWSQYLTCYGRELNVDSTGAQRINLNGTDAKTLSDQLTAAVGQELSDYILYYRFTGNGAAVPAAQPANTQVVDAGNLRSLVQKQIDSGGSLQRKLTSTLTVYNTQIPLPKAQNAPTNTPNQVVLCPLNDATALAAALPVLLDKCSTVGDYEIPPRINVSNAPLEVLTALPGLTSDDVTNIVNSRPTQPATDQTAAWLVTGAKLSPDKFKAIEKYVGGRTGVYRVQSVGYFAQTGGPTARMEAVIEVVQNMPRIVYFRDLTELGRGFDDLPR